MDTVVSGELADVKVGSETDCRWREPHRNTYSCALVPDSSSFESEVVIDMLKRHKLLHVRFRLVR